MREKSQGVFLLRLRKMQGNLSQDREILHSCRSFLSFCFGLKLESINIFWNKTLKEKLANIELLLGHSG